MCLLNINLITVDEGPLLCRGVTFQMPFNKSSSLTYSFHGLLISGGAKIELFSQRKEATAALKEEEEEGGTWYDINNILKEEIVIWRVLRDTGMS